MELAPMPDNEVERLRALYALNILDTQPEVIYDRVTRVAARLLDVPIATVCFVDRDRVWFKASQGVSVCEISRNESICGHTICLETGDDELSRLYEIQDMRLDSRFVDNPMVMGPPNIVYYLAFLLQSKTKENVGTFCIMDTKPRSFSDLEKSLFIDLGKMIDDQIKSIEIASNFSIYDLAIASDVAYKVYDEMDASLKRKGINLTEWKVLDLVINSDFATPSNIGKQLGLASSRVSQILEVLEAKNLIKRIRSVENSDRRLVKLECNDQGRDVWNYGKRVGDQVVDKLKVVEKA